MTNTYLDDASMDIKTFEEIRCLRSVLERLLRVMDRAEFVDYQMEKFSGSPEARKAQRDASTLPSLQTVTYPGGAGFGGTTMQSFDPCKDCLVMKQLREQHPNGYTGDVPCQWCPHGRAVTC